MQNVSRSGGPYPNIVHNVQSPALKQTRLPYIKISRICRHSRQSVVSNPSACRMVESRIHYVKQKEWQEYDTSCFFIKEIFEESTHSKVSKRISLTGLLMLRHRPVKPLRTLPRLASLWIVPTMSIRSSLRFSNGFFLIVHFFCSWYNKLALELSPYANTY